jgi:hypothetical protein
LGGEPEKKEKRWDRDASGSHWLPLAQMLVFVARSYDQDGKGDLEKFMLASFSKTIFPNH